MMFLLNCALKVSLILAVALIVVRMLHRHSAALRHWVLAAGILCAAISPGLSLLMPAWKLKIPVPVAAKWKSPVTATESAPEVIFPARRFEPAPGPEIIVPAAEVSDVSPPSSTPRTWNLSGESVVLLAWIAGFALTFAMLCFGTLRLAWIAFSARRLKPGEWSLAAQEIAANYGLAFPPLLLQSRGPALLVDLGMAAAENSSASRCGAMAGGAHPLRLVP